MEQDPQPIVKAKDSKASLYLGVALGVSVVIIGVLLYLWMNTSQEVSRLESSLASANKQIETLSKDGSMPSGEDDEKTSEEVKDEPSSDSDAVIKMTDAYARTRIDAQNAKLVITIAKQEANFARVLVNTEDVGGYTCVLKKVDAIWVVLFCGQSPPLQDELDQWGVPESILQS